ncbi:MAG TPA: NAD(P)/FAD-dependent oxidoreductase, partial [Firmicutes bacterium]|nr:NAD(P)/FAD-dependent oxidoreductase [Bacillota bacterium]
MKVIVIGGGPAGMMAAGIAAQQGAQVLLIEKNTHLG